MKTPEKLMQNPSFCVLPWMHLALNSTGYIRLCCNSLPGENILKKNSGEKLHITNLENPEQLKDLDWLNKIRKKMLSGEKIDICKRCYREEEAGVRSARQGWNHKYSDFIDPAFNTTKENGSAPNFNPSYIDLRLGNLCNLKCRMCNPYASKKWLEDWNRTYPEQQLPEKEVLRLDRVDWYNDEKTWSLLGELGVQAKEIYFTGGEPLLIHQQTKMLELLIDLKQASKTKLKYNTNLTILPEKIIKFWKHFKRVTLNVSIDGVGDLNNYIRNPSKWADVDKNLNRLDQMAFENANISVYVHTTVQTYNINKLLELVEYLRQFSSIQTIPYWNILNHPDHLNIKILPEEFKKKIKNDLDQWAKDNEKRFSNEPERSSLVKLTDIGNYMLIDDWSSKIQDFKDKTKTLDEIRNEDLKSINPELYHAIF